MIHSRKKLVMAIAMIGATYATAVHAADDDSASLERVEVTGSNIKSLNSQGALPVSTIKTEDLTKQGLTTVQDVVQSLAANNSAVNSNSSVGSDSGGAAFADLRGIGYQYTLVLVDGRRIANQANANDATAVDLNSIPLSIIDHIDILRDGASAIYGSDAIGGVINFITKRSYKGVTIESNALLPTHGGGKNGEVSVTGGYGDLAADGWNAYGSFSYSKQQELDTIDRGFATSHLNPLGTSSNTSPASYTFNNKTYNPLAPNCNDGTPYLVPGRVTDAGIITCREQTPLFTQIEPETEQETATAKLSKQLNEDNLLALQYFGTRTKTTAKIAPSPYINGVDNITLLGNNPNYPKVNPDGSPTDGSPIILSGRSVPAGPRVTENVNVTQRLLATIDGTYSGWDYRGGLSYSESHFTEDFTNGWVGETALQNAITSGVINPFSDSSSGWNAAAVSGRVEDNKTKLYSGDFNVSKDVYQTSMGSVSVAFGGEARHDSISIQPTDLTQQAISSGLQTIKPGGGNRNVVALTAEVSFPIYTNLTGDVALRDDKYSDVGNGLNPKVSLRWAPIKELLFRGGASTGFRAPSLTELYQPAYTTNFGNSHNDPLLCPGGKVAPGGNTAEDCDVQFQATRGGNTELQSEKSSTVSFGVAIQPTKAFTASADFYWTHIRHAIGTLSDTIIFDDPAKYAALFNRGSDGSIASVTNAYENLGKVNTAGVDIALAYAFPKTSAGAFTVSLDGTYINKFSYQAEEGGQYFDSVGAYSSYATGESGAPIFRWKHNLAVKWANGPFSAILGSNYESGYHDQNGGDVASYETWNLSGTYVWAKQLTLTAGLRNMFDKKPPYSNQTDTFQAGYDPRFTDSYGRSFYLQASYKM